MTVVGNSNANKAKKLRHMSEIPKTLRHICKLQLMGIRLLLFRRVHKKRMSTEGKPRKKIICARFASKSEAYFTLAPMSANIAQATSIHRDCMQQNPDN